MATSTQATSNNERGQSAQPMESVLAQPCQHAWVYYVTVDTHTISDRRCKECGQGEPLGGRGE